MSDVLMEKLARSCNTLRLLNISFCSGLSDDTILSITTHLKSIEVLDLSELCFSAEVLMKLSECTNLKSIRLTGSMLKENIDRVVCSILESCSMLEFLSLNLCNITDVAMTALGSHGTNVVFFSAVGCNQLTGGGLEKVGRHCPLHYLNLANCINITDQSMNAFFSSLENSNMQIMVLKKIQMKPATICLVAKKCPLLRRFTLVCPGVTNEVVQTLSMTLQDLVYLDLCDSMGLDMDTMEEIIKVRPVLSLYYVPLKKLRSFLDEEPQPNIQPQEEQ